MSDYDNSFDGIIGHQVETLTGVLKEHTKQRRSDILREARDQADALLRQSRRAARARMHEAVTEERRRRETAVLEARQRLDTAARRQVQRRYQQFLDLAWPALHRELAARWARPEARAEWCELLLEEANRMLGGGDWIVEHPDSATGAWSQDDQRRLELRLGAHGIAAVEFRPDAGFDAGLRIRRGGACLDGTIAGLLTRRTAVEGRLLAHWETVASTATPSAETAGG